MDKKPLLRVRLLTLGIFAICALLVARLFFIQIVEGESYRERADRQYQRPSTSPVERGAIYFRGKDGQLVSAASMKNGFILGLDPRLVSDAEVLWDKLSAIVPLDRESFLAKAAKPNDPYEELAPRLDEAAAHKIDALKLPGVVVQKTRWRTYPAGKLASHLIGFVGYEGDVLAGRYGLERYYDQLLKREEGKAFLSFIFQAFSEIGEAVWGGEAETEADLILTIEPTVQQTLEAELAQVSEIYQSKSAGGVIMDPATGAIIAMAALPNFDPGDKKESLEVLKNPLVEDVFEMGSIIKPLVMAAGLDAGVLTASTTYTDYGFVELNGKRIANYDGQGRGTVDMQTVLGKSLNTGMVFVAGKLGHARVRDYFLKFGFDEGTGIDLPNEGGRLIKNLSSSRDVEYATAAFGQGVAFTPIATLRALAALGNGGKLVTPHVVARFERRNTKLSADVIVPPPRQILKPETSREITRMLVRVVDESLAGGTVKLDRYQVAAKTGTAQMSAPDGGYYGDRYFHSFFGYFPAYEPHFIILLYVAEPQGVQYASETLTTPFMNLTKFLLHYYNLPPDR